MTEYVSNPPDAAALMTSARSFGNYDLAGAIADLIDNSIRAEARRVSLTCLFNEGDSEVHILDDGYGMSPAELHAAMRPASTNPLEERSPDDLGRFGWGMKSASFSQCSRLIVVSRQSGDLSGAVWDLDDIDDWKMGVLSASEARERCSKELLRDDGTEVIWRRCDRLSEDGTLDSDEFNALITHARKRLALIFHRFISGEAGKRSLEILLNGTPIPRYDPFYRQHEATQQLEMEKLVVPGGGKISIQPFILPHYSKLKSSEVESLAGDEGLLKNQGFYIYRNNRLILYGTWFRLAQHGELSQLVRVRIDISNSLDSMWRLTLDKSDAQLPAVLRKRLKQLVTKFKGRSSRVHRSKGGKLAEKGSPTTIWSRFARKGEIRYEINRDHPLIETLYTAEPGVRDGAVTSALRAIEHGFPISSFGEDLAGDVDSIHQTVANPQAFRDFLHAALPPLLSRQEGDMMALVQLLQATEPFSTNWQTVREFLIDEGWLND